MKRLIINADDFGLTEGINKGIIEAYSNGCLTSATIMTNMPAFEDAVRLIKENPELGVGVHLNILVGKPLTSPQEVSSIVDSRGDFLRSPIALVKRTLEIRACLYEIERELRVQIERALDSGIAITHLDSHKHAHCYPNIFNIVVKLAEEYGIKKIRYINERMMLSKKHIFKLLCSPRIYNLFLLNLFCRGYLRDLKKRAIAHPDYFFGFLYSGSIDMGIYESVLMSLREGTTEIMSHPGYNSAELQKISFLTQARQEEMAILLSRRIKDIIKAQDISLVSYKNLN